MICNIDIEGRIDIKLEYIKQIDYSKLNLMRKYDKEKFNKKLNKIIDIMNFNIMKLLSNFWGILYVKI